MPWPRILATPSAEEFVEQIVGEEFVSFGRRAKYMLLGLSSGATLIVHLRMTGHLHVHDSEVEPDKHTHVLMTLDDGRRLHYQDPRKFGRLWLVNDIEPVLRKLSAEPLGEDFTVAWLAERLKGRSAAIKALLLDQTIAAGVGNIYADEALWLAGIHGERPGERLSRGEALAVLHRAREVMQHALAQGGTSFDALYVNVNGESGYFDRSLHAYGREGEPCDRCATPIRRVAFTNRSSYFCPACQRAPRRRTTTAARRSPN